jgi:regulator of RNase E activity RraA
VDPQLSAAAPHRQVGAEHAVQVAHHAIGHQRRHAAPASVAGLTFVGWQQPIACGGVAVFPGDVVVTDDDGAVLIPAAMLDYVLEHAPEQERLEGWIMQEVMEKGSALPGLYPPNEENKARYEAFKAAGRKA